MAPLESRPLLVLARRGVTCGIFICGGQSLPLALRLVACRIAGYRLNRPARHLVELLLAEFSHSSSSFLLGIPSEWLISTHRRTLLAQREMIGIG